MAVAEAAVADDPLGGFLALLETAAGLARRHGCWFVWFIGRDGGIDVDGECWDAGVTVTVAAMDGWRCGLR